MPYLDFLEVVAFGCIVTLLCLALIRGVIYPYTHVVLESLTLFVALEMGLTFVDTPWRMNGLIALGQATTSFVVLLSVLQVNS